MIYYFCSKDKYFTWNKLVHSVRRNFNGLEIDPLEPFRKYLFANPNLSKAVLESDPGCEPIHLIESALKGESVEAKNRYLLFITENNSSIDIIQNYMINMVGVKPSDLSVIFGSSFRADQEYTEICRNISLIKHSMEIGKTIILLNSYNLYESLYDALNQYYYEFAGQKYVDLGLGTHRIKCSVNDSFNLIIIAEKSAVYDSKRFPVPLINRLEKHFLNSSIMLNADQLTLVADIEKWVCKYIGSEASSLETNEVFLGYNSDTIASLILHLTSKQQHISVEELTRQVKQNLLKCATPDSVIRAANNSRSFDKSEREFIWNEYFYDQSHLCLKDLLSYHLKENKTNNLIQLTTHSKSSLVNVDIENLRSQLEDVAYLDACLLESFDTQQQFLGKLKSFMSIISQTTVKKNVLFIQGDMNTRYSHDLISCVRYQLVELVKTLIGNENYLICLIVRIPKENVKNFIGFQLGYWSCYHLDELDEGDQDLPPFADLNGTPLSKLLSEALFKNTALTESIADQTEELEGLDLSILFKKLAHNSCSLLVDTNLSRTIYRINLFIKLCDYKPFVYALAERVIDLQFEKENMLLGRKASSWLVTEAANLKQINQYSTLRQSCQNYFETRLCPLISYLLSFIDSYSNLDILYEALQNPSLDWKRDLWLRLFADKQLCRLNYMNMRMDARGRETGELKQFECHSEFMRKSLRDELDESKVIKANLPFFWLLINHLSKLYQNFIDSNNPNIAIAKNGKIYDINTYSIVISQFFESNSIYLLLNQLVSTYSKEGEDFFSLLIDSYIHDFVLINCQVNNRNDLELISYLLETMFKTNNQLDSKYRGNLNYSLPIVHYLFDKVEDKLALYLKFSAFEPTLNKSGSFTSTYMEWKYSNESMENLEIHLDACIETIKVFKSIEKKICIFFCFYTEKRVNNLNKHIDIEIFYFF